MRQKLAKRIRKAAYGINSSVPAARKYSQIPHKNGSNTLVGDNLRGWYLRQKAGWYDKLHPRPEPSRRKKRRRKAKK